MRLASAVRTCVAGLLRSADGWVNAAGHGTFVAWHLAAGLLGFAALPFVVLVHPALGASDVLFLAWPLLPLLAARDLMRHGDLVRANLISAAAVAAATAIVAGGTGGVQSFAIAWLLLPPLQAVLTGAERAAPPATALALATAAALAFAGHAGLLGPPAAPRLFATVLSLGGLAFMLAYGLSLVRAVMRKHGAAVAASHADSERQRVASAHISDLVTQHGTSGVVLAASPAAEALLGAASDTLVGQGLFQRVHVADRPAFLDALARAAAGEAQATVEFRLRQGPAGGDGQPPRFLWVEMRAAPIRGSAAVDGQERFPVIAVTRDVGARKAREDELLVGRREADRANAAKSRFLATMSHELRTPLNAIIGFSEMLAVEGMAPLDEARRREYAGLIHQSGIHLLSVVNGILDMSKIEAGSFTILPEALALQPLVAGVTKLLALKAAESGVVLETRLAPTLPEIVADQRACKQILINLVSNAVKFSRPGGHVTVGAERDGEDIVLTVVDTGVGIAAEDLPRLGAPFFQARSSYDRPYEGTGLGLSVVKGLVELHGGAIAIASAPGVGTEVAVRLPLVCKGGAAPPEPLARSAFERMKQSA